MKETKKMLLRRKENEKDRIQGDRKLLEYNVQLKEAILTIK